MRLRSLLCTMSTHPSRASLSLVVDHNPRSISDSELARGLVAGEAWAITESWHRFAPMVLMLAECCLGSKTEAKDIGQEVFLCLFRKVKLLRDPDCLRSFIYSLAIRSLRTELRRRKVRNWLTLAAAEPITDTRHQATDPESRELLRRFHVLLDRLTPRDRIVFILRRMESMTAEEIAAHLEISTSTVKRSMAHATQRLTTWISADPGLADLLSSKGWER